jgi:hypothetical protein
VLDFPVGYLPSFKVPGGIFDVKPKFQNPGDECAAAVPRLAIEGWFFIFLSSKFDQFIIYLGINH